MIEWAVIEIDKIHQEMTASDLCVVTCARDGEHSKKSLHYEGRAVDIRTSTLFSTDAKTQFRDRIRAVLPSTFDVVLESDHLHVEYDLKKEADAR